MLSRPLAGHYDGGPFHLPLHWHAEDPWEPARAAPQASRFHLPPADWADFNERSLNSPGRVADSDRNPAQLIESSSDDDVTVSRMTRTTAHVCFRTEKPQAACDSDIVTLGSDAAVDDEDGSMRSL